MRRSAPFICVILSLTSLVPLYAGDRIGIGVKAGTLGVGVDLTGRLTNWLSVRGSYSSADVSRRQDISDVDYAGTLNLGAYGVLVDFHPFRGNFRLTAGMMRNRTGIELTATPTSDVTIGDNTYTPAEVGTLKGGVSFKDDVAYFGFGFGNAAKEPGRIRFLVDLGVLTQGSGDARLSTTGSGVLAADLAKEEADVEGKIDKFKLWPVLAFGISFRI